MSDDQPDDNQVPPLAVDDRARFVATRFCDYRDALFRNAGVNEPPFNQTEEMLRTRLRDLADRMAFEDLQAVLGRRSFVALRTELALRRATAREASELTDGPPYDHLSTPSGGRS